MGRTDQIESRNKSLVKAAFEAWASGTGSPYDLLGEDATWTITAKSVASKSYCSRRAFLSGVIEPFNARMSGHLKPAIRSIYAEGNTVIVFFDAKTIALDGLPYENTYAWFLEMHNDQVTKASAFFDSIAFNDLWTRVQPVRQLAS